MLNRKSDDANNELLLKQDPLLNWIDHKQSLTQKLRAATGEAKLTIYRQVWSQPGWWERYYIGLHTESQFEREIVMSSRGCNYWYAKTIIPQHCYNLTPSFFDRLQRESLSALIFDEQQVQRITMQTYPVTSKQIEFHWAKKHIGEPIDKLWVRLAEFSFQKTASFYLMEILFPALRDVT